MKKVVAYSFILLSSFILWRCASQTTPTGGPKDVAPPVLKKSVPVNKQTNFKGKVVELTFDELLKLNNPKEEIIITPAPGKDVLFSVKQTKVFIEPKDGWADTTTYSISFREGIQDLNESNPVENLHLAFSTGPTIDSLQINGKINQSLTEKIPEKITIALYQQDTFDIFQHSPSFFTKTKEDGSFKIENLKKGNYYIYAFDDKNKNLKVESKNEKFGFLPVPIPAVALPLKKGADTLKLMLYLIDSRPPKVSSIRNTGTISQIRLNKEITSYTITNPKHAKIVHSFSGNQSEILIYHQLELNDSIPLSFSGIDSLALKVDTTFYIKRIESKLPKEKFTIKILSSSINPESLAVLVKAEFSKPIQSLNYDSIYFSPDPIPEKTLKPKPGEKTKNKDKKDEVKKNVKEPKDTLSVKPDTTTIKKDSIPKKLLKIPVQREDISIDSVHKILTISKTIDKKVFTEKPTLINLALEQLFALSVENDSSKRETKTINIASAETTGILHIEISTKYKNYEVHLLSSSGDLIQKVRNVKKYTFKYLLPQEYKLMFYADLNNNEKWDAQNVVEQTMQEPTFFYKTPEGKFTFPIRSAWELGPLLLKF